ncbi:homeobox protein NANOG [Danio rerio]|uniref:Nanog n=1 Tax=Danio rerio TaxID=7955 RepID=A5JNG8_DANRE|nr:homeobox protein NANOG [Danio rerio]AAI62315.1 Zgc:193933 [Danio rerio]AAI62318.1 Zgc:193933 [Danio rerio]ABQ42198.1 ovary-expressed homeobox protein [Danio rerio]AER28355.1 nanog protein [Danio rerio]AEZ64150.1 Nanog [Danio rerio]|eukprot:NP_001091862.1 nanog homeobox [Danio rerio]
MADWKMPVSYNFNPSYHAYAYGLMYPQVSEHGVPNLSWPDAAYTHSGGVTAGYFTAQTAQSPPWSPENGGASSTYSQYPGHSQNGRLFLSYNKTEPDQKAKDAEQTSSDTPSDSEAHTPDSWSSASSREGVPLTNLNLPSWRDRDYETDSGSPDSGERNLTSTAGEEPVNLNLGVDTQPPLPALTASPVRPPTLPRKTRAAFSEEQMNALVNRFNVQRYLTPAEMKTLAGATGLTYKQVKTWFQNRRMKLKRHQRDSSWMTERYVVNAVPNTPASQSQFQSEPPGANQDHYINPQVREPVFKRSPPKTPFYPSYPQPRSPTQATSRPPGTWPLPPAVTHYEFPNPISYMPARDGSNAVNKESSPSPLATSPTAGLWATKGITLL